MVIRIILFFSILVFTSCVDTRRNNFKIEDVHLELITEHTLEDVPCCLYVLTDQLDSSKRNGLLVHFDVSFSPISRPIEPGTDGMLDSVIELKFYRIHNNQIEDISEYLFNMEECQYKRLNANEALPPNTPEFNANHYTCLCSTDSSQKFMNYTKDKDFFYTEKIDFSKNQIITIRDGDSSLYQPKEKINYFNYFVQNVAQFKILLNTLKEDNLKKIPLGQKVDSGYTLDYYNFSFFFSPELRLILTKGDKMIVELTLSDASLYSFSDKRIISDTLVIR